MGEIRDRYPMYYEGHPKLYFKRKPIFWWTKKWTHSRFILRELTSLGVAWFAVMLIFIVRALKNGPEAFMLFETWISHPLVITLNILALVLVVYHSITWFNLAPKAIVIRIGINKVPAYVIAGLNYGAWVAFSIAIIYYLLQ